MPIDIEEISQTNYPNFESRKKEYVCLRPSRYGAVCVHEDTFLGVASAMTPPPSVGGNVQFNTSKFLPPNLPLFKFEDSVRSDEKCHIMDWETKDEFLRQIRTGIEEQSSKLDIAVQQNQQTGKLEYQSTTGEILSELDMAGKFLDVIAHVNPDLPALALCGTSPVDITYMLSSLATNVIPSIAGSIAMTEAASKNNSHHGNYHGNHHGNHHDLQVGLVGDHDNVTSVENVQCANAYNHCMNTMKNSAFCKQQTGSGDKCGNFLNTV